MNDDGTPCDELVPPEGTCSVGSEIDTVQFRVTGDSCSDSQNSQDDDFICNDDNPMPGEGSTVLVSCSDGSNVIYGPTLIVIGDVITIEGPNGGPLPDTMTCSITNEEGNFLFQETTLNTSGDVTLVLKDSFGALQLESCEVDNVVQDCIEEITYR